MVSSRRPTFLLGALTSVLALSLAGPTRAADDVARRSWSFSGTAAIEQSYDPNIMLQSVSELANIESWVTTLSANLGADWRASDGTTARLNYAPTWMQFEALDSEDSIVQRLAGNLSGTSFGATYALQGSAAIVDGMDHNVVWTGQGGAPATGGATVRDRRDQTVYRGTARIEWKRGDWFVRPMGYLYIADFRTVHLTTPGCVNSVDRDDIHAGLDLGRAIKPGFSGFVAYRRGTMNQARLFSYPEEYDNSYDRVLAGLEGKAAAWLNVAITAGPEFRRYGPHVHAVFGDRNVTPFFCDASATATLTRTDVVSAYVRQFQQLNSSGRGVFDDLNLDLAWRHTFSPRASAGVTLHAYNTSFHKPATRDDWLYTARLQGSYAVSDTWTLDASLLLEKGDSVLPDMPGREYDRSVTSLALRAKL